MMAFKYALRSPETRRQYPRRFQVFLDYLNLPGSSIEVQAKAFLGRARENLEWTEDKLMQFINFQKDRVAKGEIAESTISNYNKATKLFCEMNDLTVSWKKIPRGLPKGRRSANDRAPTVEELQKLSEYPDRRMKTIVCMMASSGVRIGPWDFLQWKHVNAITNEQGEAAKLLIYPDDQEEYFTFNNGGSLLSP
jgi:hypothetical protein